MESLLTQAEGRFELEPNLVRLHSGRAIFVGDTHGDFDASKKVIASYLRPENSVIFLGDYVDRGPQSVENINYLLCLKLAYPENIFLLMGNHEGYAIIKEELDELWEEIKSKNRTPTNLYIEAMQVAAMGVRFMKLVQQNIMGEAT